MFHFAHLQFGAVDMRCDIRRNSLLYVLEYPLLALHKFYFVQQVVRDRMLAEQHGRTAERYVLRCNQLHAHVHCRCRVCKSLNHRSCLGNRDTIEMGDAIGRRYARNECSTNCSTNRRRCEN